MGATGENEIEITVDVDKVDVDPLEHAYEKIVGAARRMGDQTDHSFGRARDSLSRFVRQARDVDTESSHVGRSVGTLGSVFGNLVTGGDIASGAMGLLTSSMGSLNVIIPGVIAGLFALGPALSAVGGLAGATATGIVGMGVAIATLKIGLGGVSEAWDAYGKQAAKAGGGSAAAGKQAEAAAKAIEAAEWSLTQAKRSAAQASKDLTKARIDEKERLEDLSLSLRGQRFAEADAAKALREAEDKLAAAKAYGSQEGIKQAQDELDRAKYAYDVEHEKLLDLQEEQKKADKQGIEGSDQVVAAKDRVRDANEQVARAVKALADAHKQAGEKAASAAGGINQFDQAMKKLSPNAQAFVRELISLSQRFDHIKRQVQDRLFAGLDTTLENLAQKWLPKLGPMLGDMADALNKVGKGIAGALGDKDFMDGVTTAASAFADVLREDIGPAIDHVIHAIGQLAGGSTEPFHEISGWIERIAEKFDKWITSASKSDKLTDFMHEAARTLHTIWDIGSNAVSVVGKFISILFGQSKKAGDSTLDAINNTLIKIGAWLNDPKNQKKIQDIEQGVFDWAKAFGEVLKTVNDLKGVINVAFKIVRASIDGGIANVEMFKNSWNAVIGSIKWIRDHAGGMWNGIKNGFRAAMNWIIDRWNSLNFTIPSFSMFGMQIGGGTIGVGHINHFAAGGAGGGWAEVGEHGREIVRLPYGSSVMPASNTAHALADQGAPRLAGTVKLAADAGLEQGIVGALLRALRIEINTFYGGDVTRALGS